MATLIKNQDVRTLALGIQVSRATNTLPASTAGNIFTVSGGRILLVALIGEVTTAIQNQACTLKVSTAPTVGSAVDLCTAGSIINAPVGVHFSLPSSAASALTTDLSTGGGVQDVMTSAWLIPVGNLTVTTSATNTGSVKWDLAYIPWDNAAQVVAA
ncbi:hypothetical protein ABH930_000323 [Kitasatospora sp. GAS204A]|uniref:hypothetical protein n=1 Tax=unclassified Kitasatospora TaxID=2633591 RepID=UPI0024759F57|nr:hypothetical protein [Kitasatospora sp. GAS204B]MDH6116904.1 hypothetical protein [Kitasatospora sp. GAS204B]